MEKLIAYKRMPLWNKQTMPEAVQQKHNTKVGTWGKITVLKGHSSLLSWQKMVRF